MKIKNTQTNDGVINQSLEGFKISPLSVKEHELETIMTVKSKQFVFDSGVIMGTIKSGINQRISLYWHFENSSNWEEFLNSVNEFVLASSEQNISESDKVKLEKLYNNANR